MTSRCHTLPLIALVALAAPAVSAQESNDGTYSGERVLTQGSPGSCVPKEPVSVTIRGEDLTFTNSRVKGYTIDFSPRPDGTFVQLSADVSGEVVDIRGHIANGVLEVDVTSASCSHHWHVQKEQNR
jgi:hypothetical protein